MLTHKRLALKHVLHTAQIVGNALIGYVFLKVLANRFGTSAEKDVFDVAYSIPFLILNVGGLGFAHAVISSYFAKTSVTRPHQCAPLFATTVTGVFLVSGMMALLCALFVGPISTIMAPNVAPQLQAELRELTLLLLPIVFSFSLCTLFSAVSIAHGVPMSSELGPLLARVIVLSGLVLGLIASSLRQIALGLAVSSLLGLAVQWFLLYRTTKFRVRVSLNFRDRDFQQMIGQAMGFFVAACVAQVSMTYMRRMAMTDNAGTNAALTYALSLLVPLGLFVGKPLAMVTGPHFARTFAQGDARTARAILDRAVIGCLVIGLLAAMAGQLLADPLIRLFYGGGKFDEQAVHATSELLGCLTWSLPGSIVLWAVLMPMVSISRSQRPPLIYIGGYLLQLAFMMLFYPVWGRFALAWGYTLASTTQALVALFVVYRSMETSVVNAPLEATDYKSNAKARAA
ncbi:MAG TPA: lipid II flippase MurJ [Pirellulales bacterium]|jgi:putative peptidoglycan lipid II flippase